VDATRALDATTSSTPGASGCWVRSSVFDILAVAFVRSVFIRVLFVEATIIVALWLFGRAFS
jgi:hypothetical protein